MWTISDHERIHPESLRLRAYFSTAAESLHFLVQRFSRRVAFLEKSRASRTRCARFRCTAQEKTCTKYRQEIRREKHVFVTRERGSQVRAYTANRMTDYHNPQSHGISIGPKAAFSASPTPTPPSAPASNVLLSPRQTLRHVSRALRAASTHAAATTP
jgi:hypothetical protein